MIFVATLFLLLVLAMPAGLSYGIHRLVVRRGYDERLRVLALLPLLAFGVGAYAAFYPGEETYRADYAEVTGLSLPDHVEFHYRTSSFPEPFESSTSASVIRVGPGYYAELPGLLAANAMRSTGLDGGSSSLMKAMSHTKGLDVADEFTRTVGDNSYYVGLLSDKESIIVHRLSR